MDVFNSKTWQRPRDFVQCASINQICKMVPMKRMSLFTTKSLWFGVTVPHLWPAMIILLTMCFCWGESHEKCHISAWIKRHKKKKKKERNYILHELNAAWVLFYIIIKHIISQIITVKTFNVNYYNAKKYGILFKLFLSIYFLWKLISALNK